MIRLTIRLTFGILVICGFSIRSLIPSPCLQQDYYSPENILKFAEHLFSEKDYIRAAEEYQRYLYYSQDPPANVDSVLFKTGLSYRLGNDLRRAIDSFRIIINQHPDSHYSDEAYYQIALSLFLSGKYEESILFIRSSLDQIKSDRKKLKITQLVGVDYIYQENWNESLKIMNSLGENQKSDPLTITLRDFAEHGKQLPKKNRNLAGVMSALIPGSGKVYARRTIDGLFSLLSIGLTGWQAYDGFKNDGLKSLKGWFYGSLCTYFYLGNIYGSIVAVDIYNQNMKDKFFHRIGLTISVQF